MLRDTKYEWRQKKVYFSKHFGGRRAKRSLCVRNVIAAVSEFKTLRHQMDDIIVVAQKYS